MSGYVPVELTVHIFDDPELPPQVRIGVETFYGDEVGLLRGCSHCGEGFNVEIVNLDRDEAGDPRATAAEWHLLPCPRVAGYVTQLAGAAEAAKQARRARAEAAEAYEELS